MSRTNDNPRGEQMPIDAEFAKGYGEHDAPPRNNAVAVQAHDEIRRLRGIHEAVGAVLTAGFAPSMSLLEHAHAVVHALHELRREGAELRAQLAECRALLEKVATKRGGKDWRPEIDALLARLP